MDRTSIKPAARILVLSAAAAAMLLLSLSNAGGQEINNNGPPMALGSSMPRAMPPNDRLASALV